LIKDPAKQERVGEVLHHLLEVIRTLSRLLWPFLPDTARELRALLAIPDWVPSASAAWGQEFAPGHKVNAPKVLFPRIETDRKK
jgi:methionyl-tRNA synthetase